MITVNETIARMFERIADALELKGETGRRTRGAVRRKRKPFSVPEDSAQKRGFRVLAYRQAARVLREEPEDLSRLASENRLKKLSGIGKALAGKIHEYLATGRMKKYEESLADLPDELFTLLNLQGLGPNTLKLFHDELGVTNLDELKAVLTDGRAAELPGIGPGRIANLSRSIRLIELTGKRMLLDEARELAEQAVGHLEPLVQDGRITPTGSFRRGRESVGDIDILVASEKPAEVIERFVNMPGLRQVLGQGDTKASIIADSPKSPRRLDLRVVEPDAWGAALQYFTGSTDHNVRLRGLARKLGLKVSEYGVFKDDKRVASRTEEEVYAALDLPCFPPELREDSGEFEAAADGTLPELIRREDIKGDLHMHTTESDGSVGMAAMLEACRKRGYGYVAITDHSVSAGYAGGLDQQRLMKHCDAVDEWNARGSKPRLLKASEVDITPSGALDFPDSVLEKLDLVIASIHQGFRHKATERICTALAHPLVHIIAHPSGRIIGRREGYDIDLEKVIECAARHGKALEINAFYGRLDLSDIWARRAKEAGIRIAINTDAHAVADLDWMRYGVATARRAWLERQDVINTLPYGRLMKLLREVRSG